MASKLELRFTSIGVENQTFTINTGRTYTFKYQRLAFRQVAIGALGSEHKPEQLAQYFKSSFESDDNALGNYTVTYSATGKDALGNDLPAGTLHGIVTIEHFDNTHFDTYSNGVGFIDATLTTTEQGVEADITFSLSEAVSDPCGKFKLTASTNVSGGILKYRFPLVKVLGEEIDSFEAEIPRQTRAVSGMIELLDGTTRAELKRVFFNPPPILSIITVDITASPFGAVAFIETTPGAGTKTYSLDDINYQGSPEYGGLPADTYTAYVKDEFGCKKSLAFTVTEADTNSLSVPKNFEIAQHNSLNFVDRSQDNILGQISQEIDTYAPIRVMHDYLKDDVPAIQFKSSYPAHTIKLFGCGIEEALTPIQKTNFINRKNIYEGNYTDIEGRLAVYFTSGNIYNEDLTAKEKGHILNGNLPDFYNKVKYLMIEGIGVTQIDRISYDTNNDAYAVTQLDSVGTVTNVKITSIHSENPYEVFEFDVPLNRDPGEYIVSISHSDNEYWSDVIRVNDSLNHNTYKVSWRNGKQNDAMNYSTGITPFRRIKYNSPLKLIGKNEQERHRTDTSIVPVKSVSTPVFEVELGQMNMLMALGVVNGLNHAEEIAINGVVFITDEPATVESNGNWYSVKAKLALLGATIESLQADYTEISPEFAKNDVSLLRINESGFLRV